VVNEKDIQSILEKFRTSKIEPQQHDLGGLSDRLKKCAEDARRAEGVAIVDKTLVEDATPAMFTNLLWNSKRVSFQSQGELRTQNGTQHDMELHFGAGQCVIISKLFPSPCYVTNASPPKDNRYLFMTVEEFFNIVKVIKIFDGKKVSVENKKPVVKPDIKKSPPSYPPLLRQVGQVIEVMLEFPTGKVLVGKIDEKTRTFYKDVKKGKHLYRKYNAWSLDAVVFESVVSNKCDWVIYTDETDRYRVSVEVFQSRHVKEDFGHGMQVLLYLKHWESKKKS